MNIHAMRASESGLALQCDGLQPTEHFLHTLSFSLATTYPSCRVVRSSIALRRLLVFCFICGVTRSPRSFFDEAPGCHSRGLRPVSDAVLLRCASASRRRHPFRSACRQYQARVHHQTVAVLSDHMRRIPAHAGCTPSRRESPAYSASTTQRKPSVPARSFDGAMSRYLPCWSSRYACGKYQTEFCG